MCVLGRFAQLYAKEAHIRAHISRTNNLERIRMRCKSHTHVHFLHSALLTSRKCRTKLKRDRRKSLNQLNMGRSPADALSDPTMADHGQTSYDQSHRKSRNSSTHAYSTTTFKPERSSRGVLLGQPVGDGEAHHQQ